MGWVGLGAAPQPTYERQNRRRRCVRRRRRRRIIATSTRARPLIARCVGRSVGHSKLKFRDGDVTADNDNGA